MSYSNPNLINVTVEETENRMYSSGYPPSGVSLYGVSSPPVPGYNMSSSSGVSSYGVSSPPVSGVSAYNVSSPPVSAYNVSSPPVPAVPTYNVPSSPPVPAVPAFNVPPPLPSYEIPPTYPPVVLSSGVTTIFPPMEAPRGPLVSVYLEDNSHHQKRNRRIGGVGVTAVACAATGGLVLLPVLAGVAVNKIVKKTKEKCIYAYNNTYIYELRSALAHGLGVPPELLQLKRKGVMFEDCVQLAQYLEYPGKNRIHIAMHIKDHPVVGSVCSFEGQYVYPEPRFVDCSSYQFISFGFC